MTYRFRKSKDREDSLAVAYDLNRRFNISPYAPEDLSNVIRAGARVGEIKKVAGGNSSVLTDVDEWFETRLMPNTITISQEMYKKALYRALRLIILADIAKTDFGSSRQRDFGQRLTDFTRGFLGEIALESFLKERFEIKVELEEKEVGKVEQFLPTDIKYVWENGKRRHSNLKISIKTSKLPSLWLDVPASQLDYSEIFCFIKIGLTVDHFAIFMKHAGFIDKFVEMAQEIGEVETDKTEEELERLLTSIPDMAPCPAYIAGFVTKEDFKTGSLRIENRKSQNIVVGGCGYYSAKTKEEEIKVEGLGDIGGNRYLAGLDALRWEKESWHKFVIEKI